MLLQRPPELSLYASLWTRPPPSVPLDAAMFECTSDLQRNTFTCDKVKEFFPND